MTSYQIILLRSWAVLNVLKVTDSISVLDSFLTRRFMLFQKSYWWGFWCDSETISKYSWNSSDWYHISNFIAFSINLNAYKRLQNLILKIFRNYDFPELVFFIMFMICSLMDIRKIPNRLKITRRFYWCTGHWILIILVIFQGSRTIVR